MPISEIQQLNIVWVLGSFLFLYWGITGSEMNFYSSLVYIALFFCVILKIGMNIRRTEWDIYLETVGEKTKGQWDKNNVQ